MKHTVYSGIHNETGRIQKKHTVVRVLGPYLIAVTILTLVQYYPGSQPRIILRATYIVIATQYVRV